MKAILVVDVPCNTSNWEIEGTIWSLDKDGMLEEVKDIDMEMKPLPEKEKRNYHVDDYQWGYRDGWNACLEAIGED